jgi:hypothetical protein
VTGRAYVGTSGWDCNRWRDAFHRCEGPKRFIQVSDCERLTLLPPPSGAHALGRHDPRHLAAAAIDFEANESIVPDLHADSIAAR